MEYRKIIKFGDSSYVISLPKDWVKKNGLKKGDVVHIDEEGDTIKLSPSVLKQTNNNNEFKINFEGDVKQLKSQILYAYINNYNIINILGKDLHEYLDDVNNIVRDFMYLDIVDQTSSNKLILNSSINLFDISVYDTLRRMDRIVLSMAEDVRTYLLGKNIRVVNLLKNKEENINKLCNLIFKTLKGGFNPNDRKILKLDMNDIFYYWELALFVEKVADLIKRIPRYAKPGVPKEIIALFDKSLVQYTDAMKANFTKDHNLAISVISKKRDLYHDSEGLLPGLSKEYIILSEKLGNINNYSGNIAKSLLRLKLEPRN